MQVKRNWTMKQEQNAILKGAFREQNKNEEGGRKKGKKKKVGKGKLKHCCRNFLKTKTEGKGDKIKLRKGSRWYNKRIKRGRIGEKRLFKIRPV